MRSYEPPKVYIIWSSEIGCRREDVTDWYFDKETGQFKERLAALDKESEQ